MELSRVTIENTGYSLPAPLSVARPRHAHVVQFYEDERILMDAVAAHVAEGLAEGAPALLIAVASRHRGISERLRARGVDVGRALFDGRLTMLDARQLLDGFMHRGRPDPARFHQALGAVLEQPRFQGRTAVRAYGEMVDLLAAEGNHVGALCLEALWQTLAERHDFTLLCAYAMQSFAGAADADYFHAVCAHHHQVVPADRLDAYDTDARNREVGRLQQRARALETEVRRREELETELRGALEREHVARVEAERANRVKSEFLAMMSHELRTPLNAIGGYADLLAMGVHGPMAAEQREVLERMQRSQRHLLDLINEVLDFARLEAGQLDISIEAFPIGEVLCACAEEMLPLVRAKGLEFVPACGDPTRVRADEHRVRQIVTNLLANAVKFTEPGGRIVVECETRGRSLAVHVSDTGIGIPAEKLETIFEPFVQADARLSRAHGGVGLGLAICRRYARAMGGTLVASSNDGTGSVFTLTLPVAG